MYTDAERYECLEIPKQNISHMGFSVRAADTRYTEWRVWKPSCEGDWSPGGLVALELYDHTGDTGVGAAAFDEYEYENLGYLPAQQGLVTQVRLCTTLGYPWLHATPACCGCCCWVLPRVETDWMHARGRPCAARGGTPAAIRARGQCPRVPVIYSGMSAPPLQ